MHLGMQSVVYHYLGHCDLDLWSQPFNNRVPSMLGCILVLLIVAYYFGVTVTLTSDFGLLKSCVEHISYILR